MITVFFWREEILKYRTFHLKMISFSVYTGCTYFLEADLKQKLFPLTFFKMGTSLGVFPHFSLFRKSVMFPALFPPRIFLQEALLSFSTAKFTEIERNILKIHFLDSIFQSSFQMIKQRKGHSQK